MNLFLKAKKKQARARRNSIGDITNEFGGSTTFPGGFLKPFLSLFCKKAINYGVLE
jgi:hypothetical protein